ncbi:MAG TPA: hypothetical protein PLL30_06945 [Candidatus Krumholzibacteria bacterium]|nr:hypothetical protein [Candidatus Krumholzibacteria bacterium]HPD71499.1 hypothetical protein [Candidatus Krumholzibacteria bacterium]HRY41568.1 hypothetical protein [Candidatus Krumholzibacteria bacterium]
MSLRLVVLILALAGAASGTVSAQTSTGRHRQLPAESQPEPAARGDGAWFLSAGAGLVTSGDLFRVRTAGQSGIPWDPPAGANFQSDDFAVTLDETIAMALSAGRRLAAPLWARLDLGAAQIDMTAIARVGETADVFRWDQLSIYQAALVAEYRLVDEPSFAYLLGGVAGVLARGEASGDYDQERVGLRFGGGYQQRLAQAWGLRFEVRDTMVSLDFADYRPPVVGEVAYPDVTMEERSPQHLLELLVSLQGGF